MFHISLHLFVYRIYKKNSKLNILGRISFYLSDIVELILKVYN